MGRVYSIIYCSFIAILATGCLSGGVDQPSPPIGDVLLTANQKSASVTMIELSTGRTVAHIPVGAGPHEIAVSPDGRTAVVPLFGRSLLGDGGGSEAVVVDVPRSKVMRVIDLGNIRSPHGAAFLDDGRTVVIPALDSSSIAIVDAEAATVVEIDAGHPLYLITRSRGASTLFTSSPKEDVVIEFDPQARAIKRKFNISGAPGSMALTDEGRTLWLVRPEDAVISVLDLSSGEVIRSFPADGMLRRIAVSADGSTLIASEQNEVRVFDAASRSETGRIRLSDGTFASGVVFGADRHTAYVTSPNSRAVFEIDVSGLRVLRSFETETSPDGLAFIDR